MTAPPITGPLHITGSSSLSISTFTDIIFIPPDVSTGKIPLSSPNVLPFIPNILGMDGPVISASIIPTLYPLRASSDAIDEVTNDLPTPPFPLTIPITFFTLLLSFNFSYVIACALCAQFSQLDSLHAVFPHCFSDMIFPPIFILLHIHYQVLPLLPAPSHR